MRATLLDSEAPVLDPNVLALASGDRLGGGDRTQSPAHVSNIIRDIENKVTKPGQRPPYETLSPSERSRMGAYTAVGWAWEKVVRDALCPFYYIGSRYAHPGELELDGIYCSPDWFDTVDWVVEEFKATWRSSRRPLEPDFWHWMVQIKAYCYVMEADRARLRVFYVNGDYRDSGPQIKCWQLDFGKHELKENWEMLLNHAKSQNWIG